MDQLEATGVIDGEMSLDEARKIADEYWTKHKEEVELALYTPYFARNGNIQKTTNNYKNFVLRRTFVGEYHVHYACFLLDATAPSSIYFYLYHTIQLPDNISPFYKRWCQYNISDEIKVSLIYIKGKRKSIHIWLFVEKKRYFSNY